VALLSSYRPAWRDCRRRGVSGRHHTNSLIPRRAPDDEDSFVARGHFIPFFRLSVGQVDLSLLLTGCGLDDRRA
jgi:hypothetical protein